ncbi:10096_t:CDS:1, partial [Cetraspora pellucida]
QLLIRPIASRDEECYFVNLNLWICSCPAFLCNCFLLCKYLVNHAVNKARLTDLQDIQLLYNNFQRREDYPFLIYNTKNLQNKSMEISISQSTISKSDVLNDVFFRTDEDNNISDLDTCHVCELKVAAIRRMAEHLEQELTANNLHHVTRVVDNLDHLFTMLDDIETAQHRRLRSQTWRGSKPWTLFLQ